MLIDFIISWDKTNDSPQVTFNHQQNVVLLKLLMSFKEKDTLLSAIDYIYSLRSRR